MNTIKDFEIKQRKYMPVFPKATVYIEGYPGEDDEPMAATGFHGVQINTFYDQLSKYFAINEQIYIGVDSFIYYSEGDITKSVAPDIYVVLGVSKDTERRSFYTWSEGTVPITVFEFLSDSTANQDQNKKITLYLSDIGVKEYFIHQPEMEKPSEFRGWKRTQSDEIIEMVPDAEGGLFSQALNLWFRWTEQHNHVRLLRPYLPDGTPITTSMEGQRLKEAAEARVEEEIQRRQELEVEIERLRAELANR
ncbi:hypothetical protein C6497_17250 [Candidatus Poribacteria bacterium]|nr:MAG: hypothetical protein C6497_17250 [Candidatus Poribacteria bacterium]